MNDQRSLLCYHNIAHLFIVVVRPIALVHKLALDGLLQLTQGLGDTKARGSGP